LAAALHISQGKRHKSSADEEQVYDSVDFDGPPTRRTVTMSPTLIESTEVPECIKGCTFSLMLFFVIPSPLSWQLLYTAAKQSDTMSAAAEEQVYYSVVFRGPPTRRTVTMPPILIKSIEITECMQGCTFSLLLFSSAPLTTVLAVCFTQQARKATQVSSRCRAGSL